MPADSQVINLVHEAQKKLKALKVRVPNEAGIEEIESILADAEKIALDEARLRLMPTKSEGEFPLFD
jgi:hypothetical protein